jgi:hypothetical protein
MDIAIGDSLRRIFSLEVNDPVRARIRQWTKQDPINETENRGVRADPEAEREEGHKCKPGRFAQLAKSEAEITHFLSSN